MVNLRKIDVLIIGAGPAGTVCGSLLKQAGVECAVVDHATFPREKVCGGGLTVKAWRLLDELMPGIKYEYRPINHMRVQFEDDKVCDFLSEYEIRMTRRTDFDHDLLKYYLNQGGEFIKGSFGRFEKQTDGRILVTLKSGMQFSCCYLIAADGANSMIRKQMFGKPKMHALFLEYYVQGEHDDDIFVHFSKRYSPGCFYKFPSRSRDMYGFVNIDTNEDWPRHSDLFLSALKHQCA
jgi:flavin-dependent dehydrogenase